MLWGPSPRASPLSSKYSDNTKRIHTICELGFTASVVALFPICLPKTSSPSYGLQFASTTGVSYTPAWTHGLAENVAHHVLLLACISNTVYAGCGPELAGVSVFWMVRAGFSVSSQTATSTASRKEADCLYIHSSSREKSDRFGTFV